MSDGEIDLGYDGWAIVELFGRVRIAGRTTSAQPLELTDRIRVDIYCGDAPAPALTQHMKYPVYRLTPCTEAVARALGAAALRDGAPVARWELEAPAERPPVRIPLEPDDLYGNS